MGKSTKIFVEDDSQEMIEKADSSLSDDLMKQENIFEKEDRTFRQKSKQISKPRSSFKFIDLWGGSDPFRERKTELGHWSLKQDCLLLSKIVKQGPERKWLKIMPFFPRRTRYALKNRFSYIVGKLASSLPQGHSKSEEQLITRYLNAMKNSEEYAWSQQELEMESQEVLAQTLALAEEKLESCSEPDQKQENDMNECKIKRSISVREILVELRRRQILVSQLVQKAIHILKNRNRRARFFEDFNQLKGMSAALTSQYRNSSTQMI